MTSFQQSEPRLGDLHDMLCYRRPHDSGAERSFMQRFIAEPHLPDFDDFGNAWVRVGQSRVLWSSHIDTVHAKSGPQRIKIMGDWIAVDPRGKSDCLGADDGAGVWLMCEMIRAGVNGVYVFHRGEEKGGLGSNHVALHERHLLASIDAAIALDRKGTTNVITHQFGRCCSDTFAQSLADHLGMGYKPDSTGLFTDTANYTEDVGECTNLSVGYYQQHTAKERQDVSHLLTLRKALLDFNPEHLKLQRQPGETESWFERSYGAWSDYDDSSWFDRASPLKSTQGVTGGHNHSPKGADYADIDPLYGDLEAGFMAEWIFKHPELVSAFLQSEGYDIDQLYQWQEFVERG